MELSEFPSDALLPDSVRDGRISHAYIAAGDDGPSLALSLAAAAVCSGEGERPCHTCRDCHKAARGVHPDIIVIEPDEPGREIVVDKARAIRQDASVMPNEAARKAYIVKNAHMLNKSAQNALLKLLEEPPGGAVFILETTDPPALLATVRSRCVLLRTTPGPGASDNAGRTDADAMAGEFIEALRVGRAALCAFSFRLDKLDRPDLAAFLDGVEALAVALLRDSPDGHAERYAGAIQAVQRAREFTRQNVSAGHVSGMLCARLI